MKKKKSQAIFSDTIGTVTAVDIKTGKALGTFKGFAGSVSDVWGNPEEDILATVALDRHLRIFSTTGKRPLLHKVSICIELYIQINDFKYKININKKKYKIIILLLLSIKVYLKTRMNCVLGDLTFINTNKEEEEEKGEENQEEDIWDNMKLVKDGDKEKTSSTKKRKLATKEKTTNKKQK